MNSWVLDGWDVVTPRLSLIGTVDWMLWQSLHVGWALSQHSSLRVAGEPPW